MKRARSTANNNNHCACNGTLEILFTGPSDYVVRQIGNGSDDFEDTLSTDSVDLVIHFRPPLVAAEAAAVSLSIQYQGSKHVETPVIWSQSPLLPLDQGVPLQLRAGELEYLCYPSYNAHIKDGKIVSIYVSIINATTITTGSYDLTLQIHINTRLQFIRQHLGEKGRFLAWFPPDVDPAQWGLRVDPRSIPQRTPLWFKFRGDVSGSKAYSLLGWFCESKPMTAFQKSAMRLGTLSEDVIVLMYCHTFPDRVYEEVGWCQAPGHPIGWGASPDGVIHDPKMNWDRVPAEVAKHYGGGGGSNNGIDICRGACEFKTSRTKLVVEPYFLAQVYMEMIALQVVWCDLVRYRPMGRQWDQGQWHYKDEAHVYRIFRFPDVEARLIPLWKRAHTNQHAIKQLAQEEAYVCMRADLEQLARNQVPYQVIQVGPELEPLLQAYQTYCKPSSAPAAVEEASSPVWTILASRHFDLQRCDPKSPLFIQLIGEQIKGYASLIN